MHHRPKTFVALFLSLITISLRPARAQEQAPLKLEQTFQLPSTAKGHFDHLAVDLGRGRLFVTPEDFHAVLVLDLSSGKLLQRIEGVVKPHAVLFRVDSDELYVTDGGDGSLKIFDAATYHLKLRIPLLKDADSIGFDPTRNQLYVVSGGGDVGQKSSMFTEIDTRSKTKLAEMRIEGDTIEAMALAQNRPTIYIDNREKNRIDVIDRVHNKVVASWPLTLGKMNVAIALDEDHQRLFVGCRSGQVVVFDAGTGKELQALAIPETTSSSSAMSPPGLWDGRAILCLRSTGISWQCRNMELRTRRFCSSLRISLCLHQLRCRRRRMWSMHLLRRRSSWKLYLRIRS
jgi:DNA-binding beta-propeller fold protein YncE